MVARAAAFFDLDRTLLRGASGPVLGRALRDAGLMSERTIPGEGLVFRVYDLVGETLPSMLATRQAVRLARGWPRETARRAGRRAAADLAELVQPWARVLIDEHRVAGREVVLATTTPVDLVEPLAELLGIDVVIATRYRCDDQGCYDGTLDGGFVWGTGKLAAVRRWAEDNDVDLAASWAYSDSVFDVPLLAEVGHPVAADPDVRLAAVAAMKGWPVRSLSAPAGVPRVACVEPQTAAMPLLRPELLPWARFDLAGAEHLPAEGPVLVCSNHRSYLDPFVVVLALARRGRPIRFLGKKEVFDAPVVGQLVRAVGGIRVDRGSGSGEALREAAAALRAGEVVAILPQGTIPRGRDFFDPVLKGRTGAARLVAALADEGIDVPVVPVGLWGTERVWPRSSRVPELWNVVRPPRIRVRVGEPLHLASRDPEADTVTIMEAVTELLPAEAHVPHVPTWRELGRTFPPGFRGPGGPPGEGRVLPSPDATGPLPEEGPAPA